MEKILFKKTWEKVKKTIKCKKCRYQVNADYNASKNILKSSLDYMSREGVVVNQPKIHPRDGKLSNECSKDAHNFSRE